MKWLSPYTVTPSVGTIQWTESLAVQSKRKSPMVRTDEADGAGTNLDSRALEPLVMISRMQYK
jgi:hypothetical protein